VRIIRQPQTYRTILCVFDTIDAATRTVSGIIAAGILPVAMEMMDRFIVRAVEEAFHFGFPLDAEGVLIVELDGLAAGIDRQLERVAGICRQNHVREIRQAATDKERLALWMSRKKAFGALGRLSPNYYTQDGVVPRTRLPEILQFIARTSEKHGIRIANVFHAGDGNVHPILLYDERDPEQVKRTIQASGEILEECIRLGGAVTGEHGVGIEKAKYMPKMYSPEDLAVMASLKNIFDPDGVLNPHKVLPGNGGGWSEQPRTLGRQAPV
jgi:glycolate oxidase